MSPCHTSLCPLHSRVSAWVHQFLRNRTELWVLKTVLPASTPWFGEHRRDLLSLTLVEVDNFQVDICLHYVPHFLRMASKKHSQTVELSWGQMLICPQTECMTLGKEFNHFRLHIIMYIMNVNNSTHFICLYSINTDQSPPWTPSSRDCFLLYYFPVVSSLRDSCCSQVHIWWFSCPGIRGTAGSFAAPASPQNLPRKKGHSEYPLVGEPTSLWSCTRWISPCCLSQPF